MDRRGGDAHMARCVDVLRTCWAMKPHRPGRVEGLRLLAFASAMDWRRGQPVADLLGQQAVLAESVGDEVTQL